ncbi:MAG: restriction endonuclease subunit S, partial [Salibacteraceae bacterium]
GLLQQLFPAEDETIPKLRFSGFEGEWEGKPLKKLATYQNGKAYEKHIVKAGKYVVVNSRFVSTDGTVKKFTNSEFCPARKGDVLMVLSDLPKGRALAKCFFVEEDSKYGVNQRVSRLRATNITDKFLYYRLNRHQSLLAYDDGITQTHLSKSDVEECILFVPSEPEEQTAIADCLSALDALIAAETEQIVTLKEHKNGLMQQVFPHPELSKV